MFDVESANKVRLRDCTTTAETILKASGKVGELDAERCEVRVVEKPSPFRKFTTFVVDNAVKVVVGVCVSGLVAYIRLS
jgi:hypothetical protein